jgi:putative ABC transport system permease protein
MVSSYLIAAWRSLIKSRFFSVLNLLGLSLGLTAAILLFQYVAFHYSYDTGHSKGDQIHRITYSKQKDGQQVFNTVLVYAGVGSRMKQSFPEVEDYCRLRPLQMANPKGPVRYGDVTIEETGVYWADANFFSFFSFPLLHGDPETVLKEQFTAAVSETTAKKYFGNTDPIGKTIRVGQKAEVTITGVFKDVPANNHIKFKILVSHNTLKALMPSFWNDDNLQMFHGPLFVRLRQDADPEALREKFPKFVDDHINGAELKKSGVVLTYDIMPLNEIHLKSHLQHEAEINGDETIVRYMAIIAVMILIIAWINYINLATSRALERAKEVGIRKVAGATRPQLVFQFLFESLILNTIAFIIAFGLTRVAQPFLSELGAGDIREFDWLARPEYLVILLCIFVAGVLLSGFYPALVLSGFRPASVLKGKFSNSKYGTALRKALVVFQFTASVALIIGTAIIYRQISFLRNQDLGFNIDRTLVVKAPLVSDSTFDVKTLSLKKEWDQISALKGVAASYSVPGMEPGGASWFSKEGDNPDNVQFVYQSWVDENYIADFAMTLLEGRNFSNETRADTSAIVINEASLRLFGFTKPSDAIGAKLVGDEVFNIVGVVRNFQQKSLKTEFVPIVLHYRPEVKGYYSLRIRAEGNEGFSQVLDQIQNTWRRFFPENPFIFFFLDEEFGKQYQADTQFGKLFSFFAAVAIAIGCLGLLGLSSYTVIRRAKEIAIRKVLGSGVSQLFMLLSYEFLILILVANIIAWPLVLFASEKWLQTFARRIDTDFFLFLLAAAIIVAVAFFTIAWQVFRASKANPVKMLRAD